MADQIATLVVYSPYIEINAHQIQHLITTGLKTG